MFKTVYKYSLLLGSLSTGFIAFNYMMNNVMPSKILIIVWGLFMTLQLLGSFFRILATERILTQAEKRYKEIIDPIMRNINLTTEQKQSRIQIALQDELQIQLNTLKGEKK